MNKVYELTQEGLKKYQDELQNLKDVERPKNIQDLKDARAQGDLSENADYDAARNRQAEIEGRIQELEYILKNYKLISGDTYNLGKKITVLYLEDNFEYEFELVGSLEADPNNKKISNESPLGMAVLNSRTGQVVDVKTEKSDYRVKIINISETKK